MSIIAAIILAIFLRILWLRTEPGLTYREVYDNFNEALEHFVLVRCRKKIEPYWIRLTSIFYVFCVPKHKWPYKEMPSHRAALDDGVRWWVMTILVVSFFIFITAGIYDMYCILSMPAPSFMGGSK